MYESDEPIMVCEADMRERPANVILAIVRVTAPMRSGNMYMVQMLMSGCFIFPTDRILVQQAVRLTRR